MKKLFIADPALKNHQGHHYSVTNSFSRAAEEAGIDVIWLVNNKYAINSDDHTRLYKVELTFSQDTYDGYQKPSWKKNSNGSDFNNLVSQNEAVDVSRVVKAIKVLYRKLPDLMQYRIRQFKNSVLAKTINIVKSKQSPKVIVEKSMLAHSGLETLGAADELYRALEKHQCTDQDRVLFHTCDAHTYMDIVTFFTKTAKIDEWDNLPVFCLSTPYDSLVMPHNKTGMSSNHSVRYLDSLGLIGTRIYLHAENELLATHLSDLWSLPVLPLYIPQQPIAKKSSRSNCDEELHVYYLGAARSEKGFIFVVDAIVTYLSKEDRQDVRFTLQVSPQIMGYTPDIMEALKILKSKLDNRLTLIEHVQTSDEYQESILKADVLLLCYDRERYAVRSSGIVFEALANGKNVIATKGTFPHFIAADAGIGVENKREFIDAVKYIADNKWLYRQLATSKKKAFLEYKSPEVFLNVMKNANPSRLMGDDLCLKYGALYDQEIQFLCKNLL